jgi:hypothetical protein
MSTVCARTVAARPPPGRPDPGDPLSRPREGRLGVVDPLAGKVSREDLEGWIREG